MNKKRLLLAALFVGVIGVTAVGCVPLDYYGYPGNGPYYGQGANYYYNQPYPLYSPVPRGYYGRYYRRRYRRNYYRNRGAGFNRSGARGLNLPRRRRFYGAGFNRSGLQGLRPSTSWRGRRRRQRVGRNRGGGSFQGGSARTYRRGGGQAQSGRQSGGGSRRRRRR